jgi:hypothetical protein
MAVLLFFFKRLQIKTGEQKEIITVSQDEKKIFEYGDE